MKPKTAVTRCWSQPLEAGSNSESVPVELHVKINGILKKTGLQPVTKKAFGSLNILFIPMTSKWINIFKTHFGIILVTITVRHVNALTDTCFDVGSCSQLLLARLHLV